MIVSAAASAGKNVIIPGTDADADGQVSDDPPFDQIAPPCGSSQKGVRVAAGDTDHIGTLTEVITACGGTNQPIKIFDDNADVGSLLSDNPLADSFGSTTAATGSFVAFARTVVPIKYASAATPKPIVDFTQTSSRLNVPGRPGSSATSTSTSESRTHIDADLDLALQHRAANGFITEVALFNDVGGSCEGFLVTLNDESGVDMEFGSCAKPDGAISGSFNPEGISAQLSAFDNVDASGTWILPSSTTTPAMSGPSTTGTSGSPTDPSGAPRLRRASRAGCRRTRAGRDRCGRR